MRKCIVVIEDKKAGSFENPVCMPNVVVANRYFNQLCSDPKSPFAKWPEDFRLVKIADYDDMTGQITPHQPVIIIEAISFQNKQEAKA